MKIYGMQLLIPASLDFRDTLAIEGNAWMIDLISTWFVITFPSLNLR